MQNQILLTAALLALGPPAMADVLFDQGTIDPAGFGAFSAINLNAFGNPSTDYFIPVSDVDAGVGGWNVTSVSVVLVGTPGATQATLVVAPKTGPVPAFNAPAFGTTVSVTNVVTTIPSLGLTLTTMTASGLNLSVSAGEHWMALCPIGVGAQNLYALNTFGELGWMNCVDSTATVPSGWNLFSVWGAVFAQPDGEPTILIEGTSGLNPGSSDCDCTGFNSPCTTTSGAGRGCPNSNGNGLGAKLVGTGDPLAGGGTFGLSVTDAAPNTPGLILAGTSSLGPNGNNALADSAGLLCVGGTTRRGFVVMTDSTGAASFPNFAGAAYGASDIVVANQPVSYTYWFRDPGGAAGCIGDSPSSDFNFSNGWTTLWL